MNRFWISIGAASLLVLAGCGGGGTQSESTKPKEEPTKSAAGAPAAADDANAGTITGKVAFAGAKPNLRNIDMSANPACSRAHSSAPKSEEAIVNDNGTLRNVFVYIKSGLPDKQYEPPTGAVKLDQEGCVYKPHVLGVMTNQNIEIVNSDPTNHNVHPLPRVNQEWNESQPPKGESKLKKFAREEIMIPVKCNVHPWMRSYIGVVSHPFYAVTGDDGSFSIKGVPPGKYTLGVWHEKYGPQEVPVEVAPKESKSVDVTVKG